MRLTAKSSYALNIVGFLAEEQKKVSEQDQKNRTSAKDIAVAYGLSESFVTSILRELKIANIAVSKKGPNGGYVLSRSPDKISVRQVFEAISEKPLVYQPELLSNPLCHNIMTGLDTMLSDYLSKPVSEFMNAS